MTAREVGLQVGYLAALVGVPAIGLICLILGLRSRNRARPVTLGSPHPPPQPRAGKSGTALIVVGSVLLTLGALGIAGNLVRLNKRSLFDTDKSMSVGQCIDQNAFLARSFSSSPANDCANPANTYQLAFKGVPSANCPDGKRDSSVYSRYTDDAAILCFALNLQQGRCYQLTNGSENLTLRPDDCGEPQPTLDRVVQRIDGSTDAARCPPGDKAIAYPAPPRVYCLARAGT
ncbi:hypothetical protein [Mycobacterium sp. 1081908.1]|uniref:LppU/SCO3897 family protein n=1 Tax=Mycobacterium sp. 1081908.1 TaxID=1834066 RepID=UPI0007FDE893|nr:hypothetical protein [Mycobacterium sp. 1081908.1]OBK46968.1 hypothetical protein A5655_08240 [Mycobacterium sp. 1081908.1]